MAGTRLPRPNQSPALGNDLSPAPEHFRMGLLWHMVSTSSLEFIDLDTQSSEEAAEAGRAGLVAGGAVSADGPPPPL